MTVTLDRPTTQGMAPAQARALVLLTEGKTAQEAGNETGVELGRLVQLARRAGWYIHPTTKKARDSRDPDAALTLDPEVRTLAEQFTPPAPAPAADQVTPDDPTPDSIAELLRDAANYQATDGKIRNTLDRLYCVADRLRDLVFTANERVEIARREAEAAAERDRERNKVADAIAKLEEKLAEHRARAKELKVPTAGRTGTSRRRDSKTAEIRAWAQQNGYDVGDRGRIPTTVVEAYERAHPTA